MRASHLFLSVLALVALASAVRADVINVQFGTGTTAYSGTAAYGAGGTYWNLVTGTETGTTNQTALGTSLFTSTHGATGVGVSVTKVDFANSTETGQTDSLLQNFLYDYLGTGSSTITISGLVPGQTYSLYLYGFKDSGSASTFSFNGTPSSATTSGANYNGSAYSSANQGVVWNEFTGVSTDAGGTASTITGTLSFYGDQYSVFNGIQIVGTFPAPEPSSLLFGAGGCGLLVLRRRRVK